VKPVSENVEGPTVLEPGPGQVQAFRMAIRHGSDGWAHAFITPPLQTAGEVEGPEVPADWIEVVSMRIPPQDPEDRVRQAFLALTNAYSDNALRAVGVKGPIEHHTMPAARPGERRQ
jgi:hypothetical protein